MLDTLPNGQGVDETDSTPDRTRYPTEGVRLGINVHQETLGKHRVRLSFDGPVATLLSRGLEYPRLRVDGDFVNGLRIWCSEDEGLSPIVAKHTGSWNVSLPVRRVRAREQIVRTMPVAFQWERDDTGPVLLIPRLPDEMLPRDVIDKLPNSQVDTSTIMARAERRLQREMQALSQEVNELSPEKSPEKSPEQTPEKSPETVSIPLPALRVPEIGEPPPNDATELKEAMAMVNELVDRLGENVVLYIDQNGHVQAKRRVLSYIDL